MKRVKTIYMALLAMLAVSTVTSCDSTEGLSDTTKTEVANNLFKIADFPGSFNEGKSTRTVGTPDAGKTAWADGDVIYVKCDIYGGFSSGACTGDVKDTYVYSLTRASSAWVATQLSTNTKSLFYYQGQNAGVRVNAYYAPNYDFKAGILTLKTGKIEGTAEFLTYTKDEAIADMGSANPISLTRDYARIRMHAPAGMQVTLKEASNLFVPAEGGKRSDNCYTTTADANGNAFFYGTWTKGTGDLIFYAVAKDGDTEYHLSNKPKDGDNNYDYYTISASSISNKGYVMDAYPIHYDSMGTGSVSNPYLIVTKEQMADLIDTNNDAFSATWNYILRRDIDMEEHVFIDKDADFEGVFDGNFHTISNYTHTQGDKYWGLFPRVTGGFANAKSSVQDCTWGIIKNLTVCPISSTDPDPGNSPASNGDYAGALVGYLSSGAVMNCKVIVPDGHYIKYYNDNLSDNSNFGGLIGFSRNSYIIECASQGKFSANSGGKIFYLGGLVGFISDTYIGHCYVDVLLSAYKSSGDYNYCYGLGGIAGYANNNNTLLESDYTKFERCYAKTAIESTHKIFENQFGVFGGNVYYAQFEKCYAYQLATNDPCYNWFMSSGSNQANENGVFVTSEDQTLVDNLNSTSMSATALYNNDKLKTELNKNQGFKLVDGKVRLKWE